jgi:hypothetical protein
MPQGGLLGPPADLVDHHVGQPDGMKVVHHHGGVAEWCDQGAGIAAPGVQGHRSHPGQPASRLGAEPAVHRGPGPVGHQVQQSSVLQVDQPGDPSGGRDPGRLEEAGLVQPQRGHTVQPRGVIHQRSAVLVDGAHDGRPANPQVTGDRGDRVGVLADPPTRLGPGPLGQHRPGADRGRAFGPGPYPTGRLTTAPDPLAPGQHDRPAADRQVAHPDRAAAVELGPHPAALTADHRGRGLDLELPLTGRDPRDQDLKAVQAEQRRPGRTTVLTHLGPPLAGRQTSARYARPQVPFGSPTAPSAAPHHAS